MDKRLKIFIIVLIVFIIAGLLAMIGSLIWYLHFHNSNNSNSLAVMRQPVKPRSTYESIIRPSVTPTHFNRWWRYFPGPFPGSSQLLEVPVTTGRLLDTSPVYLG